MKGYKKLTAGLLGVVMALSVCSFTAFASGESEITVKSGESIQNAIDTIADGGVITVEEGTYNGPFKIENKKVTIVGEGDVVFTFEGDEFSTVEAVNGETTPYAGIVTIKDADGTKIENITIKGNIDAASGNSTLTHNARYTGVVIINSSATLENCDIEDITYEGHLQGMQNGFGVYLVSTGEKDVELIDTNISNFNKCGVIARENIGLVMDGCNIKGFGEQSIISQNGIQYAGDAEITDCTLEGLKYVADNEWSGGSVAIYNVGGDTTSIITNVKTKDVDYAVCDYSTGETTIKEADFEGNVYSEAEGFSVVSGTFATDISEFIDRNSEFIKDKDGNYVVMDEEEYEDYLDSKRPSHSYSLEEGIPDDDEDEEEEPIVTPEPEEESPFSDVGRDNPNYDAIIEVYEKGWMAGIGDGVFAPNGTLTRAMGVTVLWNKAGQPEPQNVAPFLDVTSDMWYAKAVAWAYEQGISAGYGDTFGPDDYLTTEQFTRMSDIANGRTPADYVGGAPNATRGWVAGILVM